MYGRSRRSRLPSLGSRSFDPVDRVAREDAGDATVREECVAREVEDPLRIAEVGTLVRQCPDAAALVHVEVRPARAVGDEVEPAVRVPLRLEDGLLLPAGDALPVGERAVVGEIRDAEIRALERHVRVIPREPGESLAVRARPRCGVEVTPRGDDAGLCRSVGRQDDELVDGLAVAVALADADDQATAREDAPVGVAEGVRLRRLGRDRRRLGVGRLDAVEPAVVEVGAEDDLAVAEPGSAAVLVDARADVESRRNVVDRVSVVWLEDERRASALLRPRLGPVHAGRTDVQVTEAHAAVARDEVDRDR